MFALVAIATVAGVGWQRNVRAALTAEKQKLERDVRVLQVERSKNQTLVATLPAAEEIAALGRAHSELEALRASLATRQGPTAATAESHEVTETEHKTTFSPRRVVVSHAKPAALWQNVGVATPIAALETQAWAFKHKDLTLAAHTLRLDDDARHKIESYLAELSPEQRGRHGSPEAVMARLLEPWLGGLTGFQCSTIERQSDERVIVRTVLTGPDGFGREHEIRWVRSPHGWQRLISDPENVLEKRLKALRN